MLIGAGAAALTAWQQAIVAAVFELCLVGVMVIYELLGHAKQPGQQWITPQEVKPLAPPARRKAVTKANGSAKNFSRDHVIPADGERIEIKTLMRDYRAWCARENLTPLDASAFLDELPALRNTMPFVVTALGMGWLTVPFAFQSSLPVAGS